MVAATTPVVSRKTLLIEMQRAREDKAVFDEAMKKR